MTNKNKILIKFVYFKNIYSFFFLKPKNQSNQNQNNLNWIGNQTNWIR